MEDKLIVTAYHGTKKLTNVQINEIYGSPPKFNALDYPTTARAMEKPQDSYWILLTYFDCCKIPLICKGIDLIDNGVVKVSYFNFAHDFLSSVLR